MLFKTKDNKNINPLMPGGNNKVTYFYHQALNG